jgi:hypothetical protein
MSASNEAWEQRVSEAASRVEEEVRRVIRYINDTVVPEVRNNSSEALRAAAREMQKLADYMESRTAAETPPRPPEDVPRP